MTWEEHAARLADTVVHPASRWHEPIATTPRHAFVPHWWTWTDRGWTLRDTAGDPATAYEDRTLVTRVGTLHADHATPGDHPTGRPTSSSTLPTLLVDMYRQAMIGDDDHVVCVTGTGYGTALLARRLDDRRVTSVDVDPHLVATAKNRLDRIGLRPRVLECDITGLLPVGYGSVDRIVSTIGLRGIPKCWLDALAWPGRLVTTLAGTGLIIAADTTEDGGAVGTITADRASLTHTRTGDDYPPPPDTDPARTDDGDDVGTGRYPVLDIRRRWEVGSALALRTPGIEHDYHEDPDGVRTAIMTHPDGSWARATGRRNETPTVHQSGPRRLWDDVDALRLDWLTGGELPGHGAKVVIDPDGTMHLGHRTWRTTIAPATAA
ncbi:protein-L-isoaspartate O-methyltransferase [Embleya sp. NPDC008237]|uniref:protein-L-isoaspartate O-methyltransferase family protein n=1 Tax=Embleya sp. NPDC008237 TaxID=3363978 RepID=UPI0036E715E2